jgi:hypothetical protein
MADLPDATPATPEGELAAVIQAIHAAPPRLVYCFAGAGSLALHWLHAVAGSSRTVLEARDCYAPRSLAEVAGAPLPQAVGAATARQMADWAMARAAALAEGGWPLLGVACTAAIATNRERRGADRAVVAVRSAGGVVIAQLTMLKGSRGRAAQEALASRLVIRTIAAACGAGPVELALADGDELAEG